MELTTTLLIIFCTLISPLSNTLFYFNSFFFIFDIWIFLISLLLVPEQWGCPSILLVQFLVGQINDLPFQISSKSVIPFLYTDDITLYIKRTDKNGLNNLIENSNNVITTWCKTLKNESFNSFQVNNSKTECLRIGKKSKGQRKMC